MMPVQSVPRLGRPAFLRGLALLALLLLILTILVGMIWRNWERMARVQAYVAYSHRIQDVGLGLQRLLVDKLSGKGLETPQLVDISRKIRTLASEDAHLSNQTPDRLRRVIGFLSQVEPGLGDLGKAELFASLREMHEILDSETDQRERVLEEVSREALAELGLATLTLTLILLLTWVFLRHRILSPLQDLGRLLLNIAKENFTPIATTHLDPLLQPVFSSYNYMVARLRELEESKRIHALSLEAEVRSATRALLEQQRSLANAEKLAAVGELAASLAHELRNPLAGIEMSCANLRDEIDDPDQRERLSLIGEELKRMARLLNGLLVQAKPIPTVATRFNLAALIQELAALTRYQIPADIVLDHDIPANIECHLPDADLRQALLNLILNAAQALDGRPGAVQVRAWREQLDLWMEVTDDGPGFSENMLAQGVRAFCTDRLRGTGLGLAMVQRFARSLGGKIELSNRQPQGACVRLLLPCAVVLP